MKLSLTQTLRQAAQRQGDVPLIHCGARSSSYLQMQDRVARLAGALQAMGVAPGDRVGLLGLNSDRYLELMLAVWWAGAVINPVNVRWSAAEVAYSLDDCVTKLLFVDKHFAAMVPELRAQCESLEQVVFFDQAQTDTDGVSYEALIAGHEPVADADRGGEDLAGIFYTGGTTGRPKGVMLSHEALVANAWISLADLHFSEDDVLLMVAPLFHLAGLSFLIRALIRSCRMVVLPMFAPEGVFEAIQTHRVTAMFAVPVMLQMMADHPKVKAYDLSSVSLVGYGASPISEAVLDRVFAAFPSASFAQGYGMTELSAGVSYLLGKYHTPEGRQGGRLRSAGRALPGVEIRVVDEVGNEVPRGQTGELVVRSPSVMTGYWRRPEETAKALRGGWMHTGDAAYMDAQGFVFIVDRLKDMIVTGGENVYCAEVENVVARHPAVAAVAVIGVPSREWGEAVHAIVVLKPGTELSLADLQAHCHAHIAGYKCPKSMELQASLPISGAGKVLKYVLREPHWKDQDRKVS